MPNALMICPQPTAIEILTLLQVGWLHWPCTARSHDCPLCIRWRSCQCCVSQLHPYYISLSFLSRILFSFRELSNRGWSCVGTGTDSTLLRCQMCAVVVAVAPSSAKDQTYFILCLHSCLCVICVTYLALAHTHFVIWLGIYPTFTIIWCPYWSIQTSECELSFSFYAIFGLLLRINQIRPQPRAAISVITNQFNQSSTFFPSRPVELKKCV